MTSLDQSRLTNTTTVNKLTGKTITMAVLEIRGLKNTDFGLYTCHAIEGNHTEKSDTILKIACTFILNYIAVTRVNYLNLDFFIMIRSLLSQPAYDVRAMDVEWTSKRQNDVATTLF